MTFALNPRARLTVQRLGDEKELLLIVDDALDRVDDLVAQAGLADFKPPSGESLYPGLNAPLPATYLPMMMTALNRPMSEIFGVPLASQTRVFGFFGLMTVEAAAMTRPQATPHIDAFHLHGLAGVHYLGSGEFGGTAFYRHKTTGFERITPSRSHKYQTLRAAELATAADPATLYDDIAYVEPLPNRLILYRAGQLHSARLTNSPTLPTHASRGRLTANLFINVM